ncbi:MAG: RNase adapter RapZ [Acidimicrobiales bacterium]|nr:RNase adapter RapZ [Acidimicrobiales bacterium]
MSDFLVLTGLSGAGRTAFASDLEDLGWFVIDRLPPDLMAKVADLARGPESPLDRVAFALRSDTVDGETLTGIAEMRSLVEGLRIVFLNCSTEVLVQRYESSRRPHPFGGDAGLSDTIEAERTLMDPVLAEADLVIDTSDLNVHELRDKVAELYGRVDDRPMRLAVTSFGYKHGAPRDADLVLDCRFLPNPHWVDDLRPLSGRDALVREYVLGSDLAQGFLGRLEGLLDLLLPAFVGEGRSYLTLAFGCTGGRHRSVVIAEAVAGSLRARGQDPAVTHRDVDR